jgi:hypothetical protein
MSEYQGHQIRQNPGSEHWEVAWRDKIVAGDLKLLAETEEWVEDRLALDRARRRGSHGSTRSHHRHRVSCA